MNKFAFIGHPINMQHLFSLSGFLKLLLKKMSPYSVKKLIVNIPPYNYSNMRVKSITGQHAEGYLINLPLLPEQVIALGEEFVLEKILKAVKLAERLGAKIIALGGFTSVVGNEGEYISKRISVPITSGNTYPVFLCIESIKVASKIMNVNLKKSTGAVIGATGDIGSISTKILSRNVKKLYVYARNKQRIENFASSLKSSNCEIIISNSIEEAISCSDVILTATTAIANIIDPLKLKAGAIVCDVGVPANITKEIVKIRKDVLVFEGGLAKLPFYKDFITPKLRNALLEQNCIYGCLGEVMLLALEKRFENFSLGRGNITEDKVRQIGEMSIKHGFSISDFFCGYHLFSEKDIKDIRSRVLA